MSKSFGTRRSATSAYRSSSSAALAFLGQGQDLGQLHAQSQGLKHRQDQGPYPGQSSSQSQSSANAVTDPAACRCTRNPVAYAPWRFRSER